MGWIWLTKARHLPHLVLPLGLIRLTQSMAYSWGVGLVNKLDQARGPLPPLHPHSHLHPLGVHT